MSKLETPMTQWYWRQIGGTLIEEFPAVRRTKNCGQRLIDGVILPDGPREIAHWHEVDLEGRDIIVVQAKRGRLGMYLMGQTFFSAELMKRFNPSSIGSVALCETYDSVLGPILERYPNMEVVIYPGDELSRANASRSKVRNAAGNGGEPALPDPARSATDRSTGGVCTELRVNPGRYRAEEMLFSEVRV